jgi:hypothetical protein
VAESKRPITASRERVIHTHAELWHASQVVLRSGEKTAKGSAWQFLASAIFTAFAFEAYLNHIGLMVYARWDDVERLSPLAKLHLICHFLNVKPVTQGAELSAINELFDFRNKIAHGRTRTIRDTKIMRPEDVDPYFSDMPRDSWEKLIQDKNFAVRVRKHVETLASRISLAAGERAGPFAFGLSTGIASAENES